MFDPPARTLCVRHASASDVVRIVGGWAVMVMATAGVITSRSRRCFPTSTIRRRDDTRNSYTATIERHSVIQIMTSHIHLIFKNKLLQVPSSLPVGPLAQ